MSVDPKIRPISEARSQPAAETRPRATLPFFRQLLIVILVLAAAAGAYAVYDRWNPAGEAVGPGASVAVPMIPVVLGTAELRQTSRRVEAVGTTFSRRAIQVVALTSGRVIEVAFEPVELVEAGDVLVRLDDDIERADLAEAEATLQESEQALQRGLALRQKNAIPASTVEQLVAGRASAQAELDRARRRLADRTVRAPFAGVVGLRQIDPGARVDEQVVLTTLDDRGEMEIEFSVPETLYGQIAIGQSVTATSIAFPDRRFEGLVATIDSRIDSTSRAFKVRALLPNPDLALPAGMFMHVAVVLESREAVMVPEEAVMVQGSRSFVYVVADGHAKMRNVTLGHREPGAVEVTKGLAPGDSVVVRGTQRLRDGAPVRVLDDAAPAGQSAAGERPAGPA